MNNMTITIEADANADDTIAILEDLIRSIRAVQEAYGKDTIKNDWVVELEYPKVTIHAQRAGEPGEPDTVGFWYSGVSSGFSSDYHKHSDGSVDFGEGCEKEA